MSRRDDAHLIRERAVYEFQNRITASVHQATEIASWLGWGQWATADKWAFRFRPGNFGEIVCAVPQGELVWIIDSEVEPEASMWLRRKEDNSEIHAPRVEEDGPNPSPPEDLKLFTVLTIKEVLAKDLEDAGTRVWRRDAGKAMLMDVHVGGYYELDIEAKLSSRTIFDT